MNALKRIEPKPLALELKDLLEVSIPDDPKLDKILAMQKHIHCAITVFLNGMILATSDKAPKQFLASALKANI